MEDTIRVLVSVALSGLLVFHRLEAEKFGVAEYHEMDEEGRFPSILHRLGWALLGFILVGLVLLVYLNPAQDLNLQLGSDRGQVIVVGFAYGGLGTLQAILFALLRYGRIRLPPLWSYPTAILNSLMTAFFDEVTFRGLILGFLLLFEVDARLAILAQALLFGLATRLGAPGRDRYTLLLILVMGLAGGWLTIATGGVGAAFMGNAVTRFAMFLCTGHPGRVAPRGREVEDAVRVAGPPKGWRIVGPGDSDQAGR